MKEFSRTLAVEGEQKEIKKRKKKEKIQPLNARLTVAEVLEVIISSCSKEVFRRQYQSIGSLGSQKKKKKKAAHKWVEAEGGRISAS